MALFDKLKSTFTQSHTQSDNSALTTWLENHGLQSFSDCFSHQDNTTYSQVPLALLAEQLGFNWQPQVTESSLAMPLNNNIANIKHVVAVASGKGGVGKSTTTVNLARLLQKMGASVGVLDADIYGPSIPLMLGLQGEHPESDDGKIMKPLLADDGVKANSIGFLINDDDAAIWRGPMASRALEQLFNETAWGNLDFLLIDLPPGTGDIQLTLSQKLPLSGAVLVTTPQDVALADVKKGHAMFDKVKVPVLGIVENMSFHICDNCGHQSHIFGNDGATQYCQQHGLSLLGKLPLNAKLCQLMEDGEAKSLAKLDEFEMYHQIALNLAMRLTNKAKQLSSERLDITNLS